jgi:hyperosmotically inducible protein
MKTKLLATSAYLLLGSFIALGPVAAYSADKDTDRSSPKAFVKDSVITTKIKASMAKDKQVSATHVKVDTDDKGVVHLSGTAKSKAEADRAEQIARNTEGVKSVQNDIQVSAR